MVTIGLYGRSCFARDVSNSNELDKFLRYVIDPESQRVTPEVQRISQGVASIGFDKAPGGSFCTSFLVGRNLMITNHHCIHTQDECSRSVLRFNYELDSRLRTIKKIDAFTCRRIIITDERLDFTLFEVNGEPIKKYPPMLIRASEPIPDHKKRSRRLFPFPHYVEKELEGEFVFLIGHPWDHPDYQMGSEYQMIKKITTPCRVTHKFEVRVSSNNFPDILKFNEFASNCMSVSGNSGGPIFDSNLYVVGLVNSGIDKPWLETEPFAGFIPMSAIYSTYREQFDDLGIRIISEGCDLNLI